MWADSFDIYGVGAGPDYEGMILARQEAYDDCPGTAAIATMRMYAIIAMMEVCSNEITRRIDGYPR